MPSQIDNSRDTSIQLKRAYVSADSGDGVRVLVDRLWARGVSKEQARLDAWMKELGPSNELRKWFGHNPARWPGFQERYQRELSAPIRQLFLGLLQSATHKSTVTLVYGARDTLQNEAVVVRDYLLHHDVPVSGRDDTDLRLLAAVSSVAAAQHSGEAPISGLAPFLGSTRSAAQLGDDLQALTDSGDLRQGEGGWSLTARGRTLLHDVPGSPRNS